MYIDLVLSTCAVFVDADFFVILVFSYVDQVRATECLQLDEVTPDGSLKITNFFQFFNLTSDFSVEVEAQIIVRHHFW